MAGKPLPGKHLEQCIECILGGLVGAMCNQKSALTGVSKAADTHCILTISSPGQDSKAASPGPHLHPSPAHASHRLPQAPPFRAFPSLA